MSGSKRQIVELGSVRGIAAVIVTLSHALFLYQNPDWFIRLASIFNGRSTVVVFFVLSGYVLTRSLGDKAVTPLGLVGFYLKRLFRIYPALWAASVLGVVYCVQMHFTIHSPEASRFFQARFKPEHYNAAFIACSFAGVSAYLLPPLWSIFVELTASLIMPFVAYVAYRRKRFFLVALLLALVTSFVVGGNSYYGVGLYLVYFYFGAAIAVLPKGIRTLLKSPQLPVGAILVVTVGLLLVSEILVKDNTTPVGALYEGSLATLLIMLVVYSGAKLPFLRSGWAIELGEISYSLYLLHFTVACAVVKCLDAIENAGALVLPTTTKSLMVGAMTLFVAIPLAALCHHYVEKPGIQAGRWLEHRIRLGITDRIWRHAMVPSSRIA